MNRTVNLRTFQPYNGNPAIFRQLYKYQDGRYYNVHSLRKNDAESLIGRPLVLGDENDIKFGSSDLESRKGLEKGVLMSVLGKPVYVNNIHCESLYGWAEARYLGFLKAPALLVNFDAHPDAEVSGIKLAEDLGGIYEQCRRWFGFDACFIDAALSSGLVDEYYWFTPAVNIGQSFCLHNLERAQKKYPDKVIKQVYIDDYLTKLKKIMNSPKDIILSIDLDYFVNDLGNQPFTVVKVISDIFRRASVITVATEPDYCPDQNRSLMILKNLLEVIRIKS